ncbi:MAG TPA: RpoL/Rpb11 RNA polymerase subunit family protein [archaeon]|nr:RpoL/Rpb11 RNA polymerase subunit family protein [archaeon]
MKIEVLENEKDTLKIEIHDNTTLVSVINENLWQQKGIDMAAFKVDHPYLSKPILIVKSKNPKKALLDATEQVIDDVKDLRKKFQAEIK